MMEVIKIEEALDAYMKETCEVSLSNLIISLCLHTPGEDYSDGEVMDMTIEVCELSRNGEVDKTPQLLIKWGVITAKEIES